MRMAMTRRSPFPDESFRTDFPADLSHVLPTVGIRSRAIVPETSALKQPRASLRSHHHHAAQSSISAQHERCLIGLNRLLIFLIEAKWTVRRVAIRDAP